MGAASGGAAACTAQQSLGFCWVAPTSPSLPCPNTHCTISNAFGCTAAQHPLVALPSACAGRHVNAWLLTTYTPCRHKRKVATSVQQRKRLARQTAAQGASLGFAPQARLCILLQQLPRPLQHHPELHARCQQPPRN